MTPLGSQRDPLVSGGHVTITPTGATPHDQRQTRTVHHRSGRQEHHCDPPGYQQQRHGRPHRAGKNVSTPVVNVTITATGPNLSFNANNFQNYGTLSVQCTGGSLMAQVDQCRFASLAITQTGGATASSVEMSGDTIPGGVSVIEGGAVRRHDQPQPAERRQAPVRFISPRAPTAPARVITTTSASSEPPAPPPPAAQPSFPT